MARELLDLVHELDSKGREIVFVAEEPAAPSAGIAFIQPSDLTPEDEVLLLVGDPALRRRLSAHCGGASFGNLISPRSLVASSASLGEGALIYSFTAIGAGARIGRHFLCSLHSYVGHDCEIGDFVTFGPRVSCSGNVHIGDDAYIGTGAMIRQGSPERPLRIGAGAIVGMGAVVTKDVPPGVAVIGNPARPLER